jgi:preprotein translocase subunit SecA
MGDEPIENKMVTKSISSAQKRVEGVNFDIRKTLLDYDDVLRQQRETMYEQRNYILENEDVHGVVKTMFDRVFADDVHQYTVADGRKETVDVEGLLEHLKEFGVNLPYDKDDFNGLAPEEIASKCSEKAWSIYERKIAPVKEQILPAEKTMVLRVMDRAWINHIDIMSKLREGIHLRSYAQNNPLQAYVSEGYELFEDMMNTISREVVLFCNKVKVIIKKEEKN